MHVGQAVITPLEFEHEACVVGAQAVQQRGVQVVNMHRVADDVVAVVVGLTVRDAGLDPAARQPDGKASRVVALAPAD